ncbi:hypothetical protein [Thermomonas sp. HDW16]|uniref:hypothetical protein n=1 Tax=Thermomonas sp. HDW16 TaxID=2714945 RepID=UPI00140BA682|nr:hypothetical protein [Thermomonas sp. HDW16]QIL19447.1 hypothetical protein G7079_01130 [Thermomonas sp. HDW16]
MSRMLPILLFAALPLSACAPASTAPVPDAPPSTGSATPTPPAPTAAAAATPAETAKAPEATSSSASLRGAIRDGNRPLPALRICAHPLDGGAPTCIDSPAGATEYRLGVAPGRYFLMGWAQGSELQLIAHATQIRCIRAPCPPDELIEVEVAAGEDKAGIDLSGGYVDVPEGWPAKP